MKLKSQFIFFLILLLSACSKKDSEDFSNMEYQVKVKINNFISNKHEIKNGNTMGKALTYYIYKDSNLFLKKQITSNFSEIKLKLPKGNYKLMIYYNEAIFKGSWFYNQTDNTYFMLNDNMGELFYNKVNFEIYDKDINLDQITLKRISSKIEIAIKDIPQNISKVKISTSTAAKKLLPNQTLSQDLYFKGEGIKLDFPKQEKYKIDVLPLKNATILIEFYDQNKKINEMSINDVTVERNHIIKYTGNYNKDGNFNVNISIDKTWDNNNGNWQLSSTFIGTPRTDAVSFVIGDYAYIGTGFDGKNNLNSFYRYSNMTGWEQITNFPGKARHGAVAFSTNGKGYVGTGIDNDNHQLKDFWMYDPTSKKWTQIDDLPGGERQDAVAFAIEGNGYVGTGYGTIEDIHNKRLKDFYRYNTTTNKWSKIAFDGDGVKDASAFVIDNKAYLCLGTKSHSYSHNMWKFDPNTISPTSNGWTRLRDLNPLIVRKNAVALTINNKAYIVCGEKNTEYKKDVWEFKSNTNLWKERSILENEVSPRCGGVGFSLNNRAYLTTGNNETNYLDDMWEYQPDVLKDPNDN